VLAGDNATFTCAVSSSPHESTLIWRLGERLLDRHGDRISITSAVDMVNSGMMTTSVLIISGVTGFDSNIVECFSEYLVTAAIMVSTNVRSTAMLSVLGEQSIYMQAS
jgi:hypothetical protein